MDSTSEPTGPWMEDDETDDDYKDEDIFDSTTVTSDPNFWCKYSWGVLGP